MQDSDDPLQVEKGKTFPTYNDLSEFIKKYQVQEKQMFVVKSSTTFQNSRIRKLIPKYNPELKYYEIRYVCKFGGSHTTAAQGLRNVCSSKMGCDAFIKVNLTQDRKQLQIVDFKTTHVGHEGSEAFFELLPQNKKLTEKEEADVINLLELRCDKKFLQDKIHQDFNKPWSRKDISNLVTKYKDDDDADSLVKAVELLRQTYKANVSVLHEDNEFKGLYFSTTEMTEAMSLWPEIVFIDGTYKLLRRGLTLMLLLVEDSVGLSKVSGAALLAREDRATFEWFLQCYKKENLIPCSKMQCMMGDKDLLERDVLKEVFPNIPIYICLFHVLRTFSREVSREKMNMTKEQREISLRFLDSLAKSSSQSEYG